jgi:hypothetical protein
MIDENRIIELEAQINDLRDQVERLEQPNRPKKHKARSSVSIKHNRDKDNYFWGFVLIILGGVWMAKNIGWFYFDISIWPVVIIAVGIYLLTTSQRSKQKEPDND